MPVGRSSRYTPPKSFGQKSVARQGALRNNIMGLGAGNMGDSPYARMMQNRAFDQMERVRAFDQNVPVASGPRLGPGRAQLAPIQAAREQTRSRVMANIGTSRQARESSRFRNAQGFVGEYGPGRRELLDMNIEASRAGRTGGFRSGNMNGRTINRAIDMNRMNRTQPMLGPGRAELAGVQNRRAAGQIYKRDINRAGRLAGIENARNARPMLGPGRDELNRILATGRTSSRTAMTSKAAGGGLPGAGAPGLRPRSTGGAASGKLGGVLDSMSRNKKLAIGAGALVLGAMVVGNRREKGTSSGRSSMYRY